MTTKKCVDTVSQADVLSFKLHQRAAELVRVSHYIYVNSLHPASVSAAKRAWKKDEIDGCTVRAVGACVCVW